MKGMRESGSLLLVPLANLPATATFLAHQNRILGMRKVQCSFL